MRLAGRQGWRGGIAHLCALALLLLLPSLAHAHAGHSHGRPPPAVRSAVQLAASMAAPAAGEAAGLSSAIADSTAALATHAAVATNESAVRRPDLAATVIRVSASAGCAAIDPATVTPPVDDRPPCNGSGSGTCCTVKCCTPAATLPDGGLPTWLGGARTVGFGRSDDPPGIVGEPAREPPRSSV